MRSIIKLREPSSLTQHRQTAHGDYSNYPQKNELRESLVREQRGLCCYCMTRISASISMMKIEHWRCQSRNGNLELTYRNLLGACLGGDSQPEHLQHCDTRKGDRDLKWNPAEPNHRVEQRIRFTSDGTITSEDPEFNWQLNDVLGLNLPLLKNRRRGVLDGILEWFRREKARLEGPIPRSRLVSERARRAGGTETLAPFDPVAVWWLDQKLGRSAR